MSASGLGRRRQAGRKRDALHGLPAGGTRALHFLAIHPGGRAVRLGDAASYVKQFKLVFTKEGGAEPGGFASIGQLFPTAWDWTTFWFMTAFLSIILAFMNILPIPALTAATWRSCSMK